MTLTGWLAERIARLQRRRLADDALEARMHAMEEAATDIVARQEAATARARAAKSSDDLLTLMQQGRGTKP